MADPIPNVNHGVFERLRSGAGPLWEEFVEHPFVSGLGDGSLPTPAFRRYLTQDYLFLLQFARAYALAGFKATRLADLRAASDGFAAILSELPLHVSFCAGWGLDEAGMAAEPEALETIAYTRFVLDCGAAGDLLDLYAALTPCVLGYAEIGRRLEAGQAPGNPYAPWIATYAGPDYQAAADVTCGTLDRLWTELGGEARAARLQSTFDTVVRLETAFWAMGWKAVGPRGRDGSGSSTTALPI
jgi:thiaminase (transcriptional activator TenA)